MQRSTLTRQQNRDGERRQKRTAPAAGAPAGVPLYLQKAPLQRQLLQENDQFLPEALPRNEKPGAAEREADRVADRVMASEDPALARQPLAGEEEPVQRDSTAGGDVPVSPETWRRIQSARGGGEPLPATARAFFEPRFGRDFSGVRAYAGPDASEAAASLRARAFTAGRDVFFGVGQYAPGTGEGKRLLAHELAHVVQQGAAPRLWGRSGERPDSAHTAHWGAVQRKDGGDEQAKKDYLAFNSGTYIYPDYKVGHNGKFDVVYQPAGQVMNVNMRLKFVFPDDPPTVMERLFGIGGADRKAAQDNYARDFVNTVTASWGGRYAFLNAREPHAVWGKLNPVRVNLNVTRVQKNQHFLVDVRRKTAGGAQVSGGVTKLFKADETPVKGFQQAAVMAGELARVNRINPSPILFDNDSDMVKADDADRLRFLGTYLKRINDPRFDVKIVGHATTPGADQYNQAISERRAANVEAILRGAGAGNHKLTAKGVGETGASADPQWRKVVITPSVPAGWRNVFDTQSHEFGHMIGLGDEYWQSKGKAPAPTHYALVKKAFGKEYADQVAKQRGSPDTASIMHFGSDVRVHHYVTFWSALAETTLKAPVPKPPFGHGDWKISG